MLTQTELRLVSIMLYVNSLNMLRSMCPLNIFAASLKPKETLLAKYDINSISVSSGNKPKGQFKGTNKEKKPSLCKIKPKIVDPNTTVKLIKKVRAKCEVGAKL